ncbi:hypothetical protein F5I97DRAFT_2016915 [Phlebopus sp. FC_14]|nr:hypothetical protein F5I97DRAFT_2016915 [Phlebopus sp. FC_14]
MSSLSLSEAEFIGVTLRSVLFGLYVILSSGCLYMLLRRPGPRGNRQPLNKTLLGITIVLFLLIASHWVVCVVRVFRAFIYYAEQKGGPDAYLEYAGNPLYVVKTALNMLQVFVGDLTMVYRLYIVWGRSWRIIVAPVITSIGLLTSGLVVIYLFATISEGSNIFAGTITHWVIAVFITTFVTNVVVSSLITFRIWSINRRVRSALHSNLMASPVIGIAFSLLIIRVGLEHEITTNSRNRDPAESGTRARSRFTSVPIEIDVLTEVDHTCATSASMDDGIMKPVL